MKRKLCLLLFFCLLLTAPALRAQQKATPRSGEGISTFLLRHNRAPKKYYNDFIELNKAKLGKSRTLKMGVTYLIPPVKKASAATSGKTTEAAAEKTSAHHPRVRKSTSRSSGSGFQMSRSLPIALPVPASMLSADMAVPIRAHRTRWQTRAPRRRICLRHRPSPCPQPDAGGCRSPYHHSRCQRRHP